MASYTDGPLKVVEYCNAESYVKGCGKSYADGKEGRNPFHARTQNYNPETIKDHTDGRATKGESHEGRVTIHSDHVGAKAEPIRGPLYRRDNGGR